MTYRRAMDDVFDHTGEVAVITGGGTDIGAATAMLFARHGADDCSGQTLYVGGGPKDNSPT